ncbi:phage holin family protein [Novosphingobium aerophilum]|uniref:Phage holin family protein n=1 Tax=Novosphingobium aerophilum TaxID=2839843 RepID=A0A7X1F552_9SPHN|nr:phage holin family protein [Novosphingobium aerophilum]MBC2650533.1 phage holin family protein [Novosphingobium aerophilum]
MTHPDPDPAEAASPRDGVAPLIDDLRQFADEARAYAAAEVAFQKARGKVVALGLRRLALLGFCALSFAVFALGALVVGLLLALTPLVTAWGATAIVAGLLVLAALLSVRSAMGVWRRMVRVLTTEGDDPA